MSGREIQPDAYRRPNVKAERGGVPVGEWNDRNEMEAWQSEAREKLYREAEAASLFDAAYLFWWQRDWLNSIEGVQDGPDFPPLPEGDAMPEIVRRVHLSRAFEIAYPERGQTMQRLGRSHPETSVNDRLFAVNAAARLDRELFQTYSALCRVGEESEPACQATALEKTKHANPGFSDASYRQAGHLLSRAMV